MERKKLGAGLIALVAGIALSAGSAFAQLGYLMGDPSDGKLVPYYEISQDLSTIIGLENVFTGTSGVIPGNYIFVHVVVFDVVSVEVFNATLCLSPYDFGFVILQQDPASPAQLAEVGAKVLITSVTGDFIPNQGYVTLAVVGTGFNCLGEAPNPTLQGQSLAAWTIKQDVGTGFTAVAIPTVSANVSPASGVITCAGAATPACSGLIPGSGGRNALGPATGNLVSTRYDINPTNGSETAIYIWLNSNGAFIAGGTFVRNISGFLNCEHELQISTTIPLPFEVNVIDPSTLGGIGQCIQAGQYRGVLRFLMPDTGQLWSEISQKDANFRMHFDGYNHGLNPFIP